MEKLRIVFVPLPPNEMWKLVDHMHRNPGLYSEEEVRDAESQQAAYEASQRRKDATNEVPPEQ